MPGTRTSVELFAQSIDNNPGSFSLGIHFVRGRREKNFDSFFFQQCAIALERPGIFREVFRGTKLSGVDEQRDRHSIALRSRRAHQRQVAFVQCAHGGHQPQPLATCPQNTARGAGFADRAIDIHCFGGRISVPGASRIFTCRFLSVPTSKPRFSRSFAFA